MRSVLGQVGIAGGFELIAVDGDSNDGTRQILARLAEESSVLRVLNNPAGSTPAGMNIGIRAARGRYIAIMGAHNIYSPDYLANCYEIAEVTGADNVGGAVIADADSYMQRAIAASHHSRFSVGGAHWHDPEREGPAEGVWGGFFRREVFDRIGLFDEGLLRNQDDELNLRLLLDGGVIWQTPKVISWYRPRASLRKLFSQYRQYGYWKVRVIQKHQQTASWRHLVPAIVALTSLGLTSAALANRVLRKEAGPGGGRDVPGTILWCGLAAYIAADLSASTVAASRAGWDLLPALPLVFPAYHGGYAIGFLEGAADFLLLGRGPKQTMSRLTR